MPKVFISYSHKDEEWKDRLVKHLSVLEKQGNLTTWNDRDIIAGSDWLPEIEEAIATADVAVLMISANFLTSDFILNKEVPRFLAKRQEGGMKVLPLFVKPCAWKQVDWLNAMQGRPEDGRAISGGTEHQIDTDLTAFAEEIYTLTKRKNAPIIFPDFPETVTRADQFKILLIEDNPGDVRLVEVFLGESDLKDSIIINHKTLTAGLEALGKMKFDVILLDFNLPDSSGYETLYSTLEAYPNANVIVFVGMDDKELGIRCVQAGAQDYLVKGDFGSDFLVKTLRYAIERNRNKIRLEAAQREANKINERYTRLFTQSKDTISITTESGEFVDFNQAIIDLLGYSAEELQNEVNITQIYKNSDDRRKFLEIIKENGYVHDYSIELVRKDGVIRHCLITSNIVKTEDGVLEYHSIISDITKEVNDAKENEPIKLKIHKEFRTSFQQYLNYLLS